MSVILLLKVPDEVLWVTNSPSIVGSTVNRDSATIAALKVVSVV